MVKQIPNIITLINLACGCLAVVNVLEGKYLLVFYLVGASLLADFLDGMVARILNAKSELGAQLDSLADAVSFGVLPGAILYVLIESAIGISIMENMPTTANYYQAILRIEHLGFLFTLFAIYRLGKFNIDTRQTSSFLGLASPGATLFVIGLLMVYYFEGPYFYSLLANEYLLIGITIALGLLMISEFPMFAFKIGGGDPNERNEVQLIFLVLCVPCLYFLKFSALPVIIILYMVMSIIKTLIEKKLARSN